MADVPTKPRWSLPYETVGIGDPAKARPARAARIAAYSLLAVAMIVPVVQFQHVTRSNQRKQAAFELQHGDAPPEGAQAPKASKGAIGRWRKAVMDFWQGENIYLDSETVEAQAAAGGQRYGPVRAATWLHPNMPFTVMLLSPFAFVPTGTMAIVYNILKLAAVAASVLMLVSVMNHRRLRMADWVVGLALLGSVLFIVGDIQHGNTNVFVLFFIVLHLWLFRRGRDGLGGAALAMAVCIKMTPAIFLLYWLYQRNWKLLGGAAAMLALAMVVLPLAASIGIVGGDVQSGCDHYATITRTWLDNLIVPGLVKGAWYPIHINQSLSGVVSRYFLDGPGGDIFWNPDDNPYSRQAKHGWITVVPIGEQAAKTILRLLQLAIVAAMALAIGWRKLPRDDGRRGLHYALVAIGMMLLNQRTWDHHATVMLVAAMGVWYAIAFGNVSARARKWALGLALASGVLVWSTGNSAFELAARLSGRSGRTGELWADWFDAYGPTFWHFMLMLLAAMVLAVSMKCRSEPFMSVRQPLGKESPLEPLESSA